MALTDRPILAMMGGQILIWAALFYSFPALVLNWQAEFGWTGSQVMGAYTLAIAVYALGAPLYGRLIDRGLAGLSLPGGAVAGAVLLAILSRVETLPVFYVVWGLLGICMGLTLYEACFAIITRARAETARGAITAVALVAGFASTLAYPLIAALNTLGDWRQTLLFLAAMVLILHLPLVIFASRRLEDEARTRAAATSRDVPERPKGLLHNPAYWWLAAGFACASFATGLILSHLFPLMAAQGIEGAVAITAASLIGPAQVVGRVAMMTMGRSATALRMAQLGMSALALGAILVAGSAAIAALIFGFAVAQGAGYGVVGILRAVATRDVLGQENYGAIAGAVSLPSLLAFALAPLLGAAVADWGGYGPVIALCGLAPLAGALCLGRLRM